MLYESLQEIGGAGEVARGSGAARVVAVLPEGVAWLECAAASLRAALRDAGLQGWRIFHCAATEIFDLDKHLRALDPRARWRPLAPAVAGGVAVGLVSCGRARATPQPPGWVHFASAEVAVARWY